MKDAYYFSHDSNARNDPRLAAVKYHFGLIGVAAFWAIIEVLREQANYSYPISLVNGLRLAAGISEKDEDDLQTLYKKSFQDFMDFCVEIKLFEIKNDNLVSPSLLTRMTALMEKRKKLSKAGKRGATKRWGGHKPPINTSDSHPLASKVKESKVKDNINRPLAKAKAVGYCEEFEKVWTKYPKPVKKKEAYKHFLSTVKSPEALIKLNRALDNYVEYTKGKDIQHIQNGSTWFNDWESWVDFSSKKLDPNEVFYRQLEREKQNAQKEKDLSNPG